MDKLKQLESFVQLGDSLLDAFEKTDIDHAGVLTQRRQELVNDLFDDSSRQQDWSAFSPWLEKIKTQDAEILKASRVAQSKLLEAGRKIRKGRLGAQSYKEYTTTVVI
ncbi:MAG: hypothetical protein AAF438_00490 [Pseudomonadota bacterium]